MVSAAPNHARIASRTVHRGFRVKPRIAFAHVAIPAHTILNREARQERTLTRLGRFRTLVAGGAWMTLPFFRTTSS